MASSITFILHTLSKEELFAFGESKQIKWEQKLYIYVLIILQPLTGQGFFYEKQSKSRLKVVTCVQFRPIIFFKVLPPNKPRICNLHAFWDGLSVSALSITLRLLPGGSRGLNMS